MSTTTTDDIVATLDQAENLIKQAVHQLGWYDHIVPDYYPVIGQLVHLTGLLREVVHRIPALHEVDPRDYYDHDLATGKRTAPGLTLLKAEEHIANAHNHLSTAAEEFNKAWSLVGRIGKHPHPTDR